jgi:hypothetical protein
MYNMCSPTLEISDLRFLEKYTGYLSPLKKYNKYLIVAVSTSCRVMIESIIFILWWACAGVVITSFGMYRLCEHNPMISPFSKYLYLCSIYVVSKVLDLLRMASPSHSRKAIIYDKGTDDPYLERIYLLLKDRKTCKFNIFLHRFIKGDNDDIHDHPWGFFHIILSGGYWEYITVNENGETLDQGVKKIWRSAGYYNMTTSNYKHRIVLGREKPWTLFIPFQKEKTWNFWIPMIWKSGKPCEEGDINDDANMKCTNWKSVNHEVYIKKKRAIKKTDC